MDLLKQLIISSEKAANVARLCRQDEHLFQLLIQQKDPDEANPRFIEDFKTLADVLIQEMVKHDLAKQFPGLGDNIKGEENNTFCNKLGDSIAVSIKDNWEDTSDLLKSVLNGDHRAADLLAKEVHKNILMKQINTVEPSREFNLNISDIAIWIDPIDSTAEYINGIEKVSEGIPITGLKCVTVLIGVYDKFSGLPLIGIVNQPFVELSPHSLWSGCCIWGVYPNFYCQNPLRDNKIICISSSEDKTIISKLKDRGFNLVEASGAGSKILTVIKGLAQAYVLSKNSTFKWDTCGPQAILRSMGGDILNYELAIQDKFEPVQYGQEENCNRGGILVYRDPRVLKQITDCLK